MPSITLDNISLTFPVQARLRTPLKDLLIRKLTGRTDRGAKHIEALKGVSLDIQEGERVAIVGHNGAGKSTLLKVIAGIYPPTFGRRTVDGEISSLFDLTLGFEMHATGRENIAYRGYMQNQTPRTIREKSEAIAEFCGLGEFLDMPVRLYSPGMLMRLAFGIATAIDPEILLVDECLSVGDLAFHQKARQRMRDMMDKSRLIVMVTHDLNSVLDFSTRAIWMDRGRMIAAGSPSEIVDQYSEQQLAQPAAA